MTRRRWSTTGASSTPGEQPVHDDALVDSRQPQLAEMLAGLQRLSTAVAGPDGQLDLLLDQGNAALATLAATVSQSGAAYGDAITDLEIDARHLAGRHR